MEFHFLNAHPALLLIGALFCFGVIVQLAYFIYLFSALAFAKKRKDQGSCPNGVSVVIPARNEYFNLKRNLPLILAQDYPEFEVVVVNNGSDDDTDGLLQVLEREHERLKVISMKENLNFFSGKKFPLALGIRSAKYECLLLTDADCYPASPQWIQHMMADFAHGSKMVIGVGRYETKPGLLNKLIRYDATWVAMQYLSFAMRGFPYMGVGRNLAYTKSLFFQHHGFVNHYKIQSGDDDLFVNHAAHNEKVEVQFEPEAHTLSAPKSSFALWCRQKRRHLTSGAYYRKGDKMRLAMLSISRVLFWVGGISLLLLNLCPWVIVGMMLLRIALQLLMVKRCMVKLGEKNFLLLAPLFDILLMLLIPFLVLVNVTGKKNTWR